MDYPAYSEELFYDKAGNRARRLVGGEEELYQYDPRNRLMALTRGGVTAPFQYDNAGNLLRDDKARYSYDAFNRTVKVETFDGNVQVNRYDAEGLRHEMEENGRLVRFIFHKGEAVAEQEENSNVIRLIRGSELIARSSDSESARTYYHYASDEMGSTTHIVDESGNVQNRYAYDAWGKIEVKEEAVLNRFTYYGQQIDPITQQYYLRARFYNPVIGRFTQEDTYRGDGLNLYAYCQNNAVMYIDPSGFGRISPVVSDNPAIMSLMQQTTQQFAGINGQTVGAIPTGKYFEQWFDDLSVDELKLLMSDSSVYKQLGSTGRLRLGGKHEFLKVSQMLKLKQLGLTAYEIRNFSTSTIQTRFLDIDIGDGVLKTSLHLDIKGKNRVEQILLENGYIFDGTVSSIAHRQLDEIILRSNTKQELLDELLPWLDKHFELVEVQDDGTIIVKKGHTGTPVDILNTTELNPSPRSVYS